MDVPVLKYTGSKWTLADWIISQFAPHKTYVEPFAGSAAIFFRKHPSMLEVLNDLDGQIVNFFKVLRDQPDDLVRAIDLTPYSRQEYEIALQFDETVSELEQARRFYVASWQSFGGTLTHRSGWSKATNPHKSHTKIWNRLEGLIEGAKRLKEAQIENSTALKCIDYYDSPETLFYVDPPYVFSARAAGDGHEKRGRKRYRHEMDDQQQVELAHALNNVQGMVILSGYGSSMYDDLYKGWGKAIKKSRTQGNTIAEEVLWLSPKLMDNQYALF